MTQMRSIVLGVFQTRSVVLSVFWRSIVLSIFLLPPAHAQLNCSGGCGTNITAPRFVQSATAARDAATVVFPNNVVSGDVLIVALGWSSTANTTPSISDTLTTTWTKVLEKSGAAAGDNLAIFTGTASSSGADTVTPTYPAGAGFKGVYAVEFDGTTVLATLDGTGSSQQAGSNIVCNTSLTTAFKGDLILGYLDWGTSTFPNYWASSSTIDAASQGSDGGMIFHQIQSASAMGLVGISAGSSNASTCAVGIIALKHG